MIIHLWISRVNHLRTKTINEFEENEYNNYKLLWHHDLIANLIVVYFLLQGNHGSGSYPKEDFKVFKKYWVCDHLCTILLSMVPRTYFIQCFHIPKSWCDTLTLIFFENNSSEKIKSYEMYPNKLMRAASHKL